MTRGRKAPDGLPYRLYQSFGLKVYSIAYKGVNGKWAFRYKCSVLDKVQIDRLRRDAIRRVAGMGGDSKTIETFAQLSSAWFTWQDELPGDSLRKRAKSTMDENRREAKNLRDVFGEMLVSEIKRNHAYGYLLKCEKLKRGPKGNKEVALLTVILEHAIWLGVIEANPCTGMDKLPTRPSDRYVEDDELALALKVGAELGGASHIVALALQAAYLCVRRSVEVRALQYADISPQGINWLSAKKQAGASERRVLIEWSPDLRAVIDQALDVDRRDGAVGTFVFGNLDGERYTKGGWKSNLSRLMLACERRAADLAG